MTKQLLVIICLALGGPFLGVKARPAQTPCADGHSPTAQDRIAKRDIQERINDSIDADIARDTKAATRNLTEDFTLRLLDGTVLDRAQFLKSNEQQKSSLLM